MEDNIFFLDLNFLEKKGDKKLKKFAEDEELDEKDIIKIIYNEANRIGVKDKVKVTFKIIDIKEGSFRVIVEPSYVKYKEVVIYPFDTIKSPDFELPLDIVCGRITLYNKKDILKNISVTIDYVALDIFAMTYKKAKEFLVNISDRKGKNRYLDLNESICFKQYGIKINAKKDNSGKVLENELVYSIDVYNKDEFFKEFYFIDEKKQEEKYDVNIPITIDINANTDHKKEETNLENINKKESKDEKESEFIIEIPQEEKNINRVNDVAIEEIKQDSEQQEKMEEKDITLTAQNKVETLEKKDKDEIEELEKLFEQEKKQQEILEKRIKAKLEELKNKISQEDKRTKQEQSGKESATMQTVSVTEPENYSAYEIESYKGIKEKGKNNLCVYFGQRKNDIRKYFGGMPKEIREYDEMEIYDVFYAYYDEEDLCTGIGIYNQDFYKDKIALYFEGENLITMTYSQIVKLLKKYDFNTIEDEDGIISLKYGISVDPKECDDFENKICDVIHIFKKGYYDEVYENV